MQVFASKDAEIEDLRKRLAATEKQRAELEKAHAPCDDLIASLRKQLAALELTLTTWSCSAAALPLPPSLRAASSRSRPLLRVPMLC